MPLNPLKLIGLTTSLLIPIQKAISLVLPDFIEESLEKGEKREAIVDAADVALIQSAPEARLVPSDVRKRIIRRSLDTLLDELLLASD